jgi:hypothetical protein
MGFALACQAQSTKIKMTRKKVFEITVRNACRYLRMDSFENIERRLAEKAIQPMGLDVDKNTVELHLESMIGCHFPKQIFYLPASP